MEYEIDFLPVGEESKGGDAICFRYWDATTPQFVGIIDGGTADAGEALVTHVQKYYGTKRVDVVINTHPHADHTSGLYTVVEKLDVQLLMMHKPWDHAVALKNVFQDGRITSTSIDERVRNALQHAHDLHELATKKRIPIVEPFAEGNQPSPHIQFLSPTVKYYQQLLLEFTATPKAPTLESIYEAMMKKAQKAVQWAKENWNTESLVEPVEGTNAENNSSVVTLLSFGDERFLFTADAGVPTLELSCAVAEILKIPLASFKLVQIPHHGSKRNVGPSVLNKLVGVPVAEGTKKFSAYVSVPKKGEPKHPSKRVCNAFTRRGGKVVETKGTIKYLHSNGVPLRPGWVTVEPMPLHPNVEEDDSD
ncbi:MAG TPA: MBL fold metallo-hydrolase [Verrucomicrobiae bacterium]|nr:MBL fold metallo-hydrolase [Verrucomicrobiae bacterium]